MGNIRGIGVVRSAPYVCHLFFADNSIFFANANLKDCDTILSLFKIYKDASSQQVNFRKTIATFSPNTPPVIRHSIKAKFQVKSEVGHGQYLGLPSVIGRRKIQVFLSIKERV